MSGHTNNKPLDASLLQGVWVDSQPGSTAPPSNARSSSRTPTISSQPSSILLEAVRIHISVIGSRRGLPAPYARKVVLYCADSDPDSPLRINERVRIVCPEVYPTGDGYYRRPIRCIASQGGRTFVLVGAFDNLTHELILDKQIFVIVFRKEHVDMPVEVDGAAEADKAAEGGTPADSNDDQALFNDLWTNMMFCFGMCAHGE